MISATDVARDLEAISGSGGELVACVHELTESWIAVGVGIETVEPVLRFMEAHASIDFGSPGPLVHFVERFAGARYVEALIASLDRRPTSHTAWMMNHRLSVDSNPW